METGGGRERGANQRSYLKHADGDGLVGAGDADERLDRLLRRLRHSGRLLSRRRSRAPRRRGRKRRREEERSREAAEPCVLIQVLSMWCFLIAHPARRPWAVGRAGAGHASKMTPVPSPALVSEKEKGHERKLFRRPLSYHLAKQEGGKKYRAFFTKGAKNDSKKKKGAKKA